MTSSTGFMDAFGIHTATQAPKTDISETPQGSSVAFKVINIRNLLSYIPIVSTIVGIAMFVFFYSLERSGIKSGIEFRNFLDLFYLVPIVFVLDIIATIGRNISKNVANTI